eukprot:13347935-Alexandrium_andersonii.AAC.1
MPKAGRSRGPNCGSVARLCMAQMVLEACTLPRMLLPPTPASWIVGNLPRWRLILASMLFCLTFWIFRACWRKR